VSLLRINRDKRLILCRFFFAMASGARLSVEKAAFMRRSSKIFGISF
jgi:hypothetical protein